MIVLVTGATSGFGEEMARKFVKMGNKVIATGRRRERLDDLAAELGNALPPLAMDVSDKASIAGALDSLPAEWRDIDLVGTGVRASNIAPGLSGGAEFSNVRLRDDAAAAQVSEGTEPLMAADIAEAAYWIATLPPHVSINYLEMMPTCQGFSAFTVKRNS